ncbi:MAG: hypothetical protein QGH20_00100 [Candidatus Latescibacteria bacterium]|jgi:hypothetical protein|nr:hypothetical protein [Candidatus Latescibacterota bacterium]
MPSVNYSVFMTAQNVDRYGKTAEDIAQVVSDLKDIGAGMVFLEVWRGAMQAKRECLIALRDACEAADIETGTGIMPVRGRDIILDGSTQWDSDQALGGNSRWGADLCYSRPWTRQTLKDTMQFGAGLFDTFIIDDALCTQCTCPRCRENKGDRSWSQFRCDLLVDVSHEELVAACREVNPNIKMILKFPQWYDRLHEYGYDTERQPALFDATWIGTETRDPDTPEFGHVPQYEGAFNVRWHGEAEPNLEGSWFDSYDCDSAIYVEQAYQSVLGGSRQLTLFCYDKRLFRGNGPYLSALKTSQPRLETLGARLDSQTPVGITTVRPHNPVPGADGYVFDGLGMIGFPLVPTAEWPQEHPSALLVTSHLADDPNLTTYVSEVVSKGGTVFVTAALLELKDTDEEFKTLAGYGEDGWAQSTPWTATTWTVGDQQIGSDTPASMRFDLRPSTAEVLAHGGATAHWRTEWIPVVTWKEHESGGAVVVLNVCGADSGDFPMHETLNVPIVLSMQLYPTRVINVMQQQIAQALGCGFLTPAKVAVYPFSGGDVVIQNFTDTTVTVTPIGEPFAADAKEHLGFADLVAGEGSPSLSLPPRTAALVG